MKTKIYKLNFKTPVYIGTNSPTLSHSDYIVHADTMFSAIVNCWLKLYPEDRGILFSDNDSVSVGFDLFKISSAFPFYKETLFLPKPESIEFKNCEDLKAAKRAKFIEYSIFLDYLNGADVDNCEVSILEEDSRFIVSESNTASEKPGRFIYQSEVVRIKKNSITGETLPYYFTRCHFKKESGLFLLAIFKNDEIERKFDASIRLLGDTGIGGERSIGHGLFWVEKSEIQLPVKGGESSEFINLSTYNPIGETENINFGDSYYVIQERKGWIEDYDSRGLRKNPVKMIMEGSVLNMKNNFKPCGSLILVSKPFPELGLTHNVYRYGCFFGFPINNMQEP